MRLITKSNVGRGGPGFVKLVADNIDDIWNVYNLLIPGDKIETKTMRKVTKETSGGTVSNKKKTFNIELVVEDVTIDFESDSLRIKGKNCRESEFIKMNAYHTVELVINQVFKIIKEKWDSISLERLDTSINIERTAEIAVLLMQSGYAQLYLLTNDLTKPVGDAITQNLPQKRAGTEDSKYQKCIEAFYMNIYRCLSKLDYSVIKVVIIGSPGSINDDLHQFILLKSSQLDDKIISRNKTKFMCCHTSGAHSSCIKEILENEGMMSSISDLKSVKETNLIKEFYTLLSIDPDKTIYGFEYIEKALELSAIHKLMISDALFRSKDLARREYYVKIVEKTKESGSEVYIFSSLHSSGKELDQLGGIAGILRYPIPQDAFTE